MATALPSTPRSIPRSGLRPDPESLAGSSSSEAKAILAAILAIVVVVLFFVYGLPALRGIDRAPTATQDLGSTVFPSIP
jgi:hypothetical protein